MQQKKNALKHSIECDKIIQTNGLSGALDYCRTQGIEPPQCSLTAQSDNADMQRKKAERMLCETKWWERRLKNQAIQIFESEKISSGQVTNIVSDETLAHYKANKIARSNRFD